MVCSAAEACAVIEAAHYPPRAARGWVVPAQSARSNRVDGHLHEADDHVSVFVQVETAAGVEAAADIAAVEGVDGVFLGPSDLAASPD